MQNGEARDAITADTLNRDDRNNALPDTLDVSCRAEADYRADHLMLDFEGDFELIAAFTLLFRGEEPTSDDLEGDTGASA